MSSETISGTERYAFRFANPADFLRNQPGFARYSFYRVSPLNCLATEVQTAFERALADEGKIAPDMLRMRGTSGKKYRRFINNLIEAMPDPRYLEIGVWQGSTLCSAYMKRDYGNMRR